MNVRLTSLRTWLLVAMLVAAAASLIAARFAIERIRHAGEVRWDRAQDQQIVETIAQRVDEGAGGSELDAIQAVLPYHRIVVVRAGTRMYEGPQVEGEVELSVSHPISDGRVVLVDYQGSEPAFSSEVSLVVAASVLIVILVAFAAATLLTRIVKAPLDRAAVAADRVAGGDFTARIDESAPGEFGRLARAFDSMASRLESAERDRQRFLEDIVHELATPANAISGLTGALLDRTIDDDDEREEAGRIVEAERARLEALLDDLRRLTQLDRAEHITHERVDLLEVARTCHLRFVHAARGADVELTYSGRPAVVMTDRSLVETILDNFVSNALRYTPRGGRVEIESTIGGNDAVIRVRDNGIGIAADHLGRIFDRFYRVDEARDRASGGSGLGLAIASRAAPVIGARIDVRSEPGAGSVFSLSLPVATTSAAQERPRGSWERDRQEHSLPKPRASRPPRPTP